MKYFSCKNHGTEPGRPNKKKLKKKQFNFAPFFNRCVLRGNNLFETYGTRALVQATRTSHVAAIGHAHPKKNKNDYHPEQRVETLRRQTAQ